MRKEVLKFAGSNRIISNHVMDNICIFGQILEHLKIESWG